MQVWYPGASQAPPHVPCRFLGDDAGYAAHGLTIFLACVGDCLLG